ncbi:MAG TPA: type II toxin-antitoxin system HicA family toxin [Candidatus Thermoplasmatota archaeon]|nr:type II toxin-antitoxin system HicA family toxin [Candidatus Thermoplasmatota archaeon]
MARLPGEIDGRRFLRTMRRLGWVVGSSRGSHVTLVHVETGQKLFVAFHGTMYRPAVQDALEIAGITPEEFLDAY